MQLVKLATALFVAAVSTTSVLAADVDVVGSWTTTAVPGDGPDVVAVGVHSTSEGANAEPTPDVSVVGSHTVADDNEGDVVSVAGVWSKPASDDYSTRTYCYENVITNGVTSTVEVTTTIENGVSPYGVNCQIVYRAGGGIVTQPLSQAAAPSRNNLRIILPVVFSIVGLIILIAGILVFLRLRARRNAQSNREWVNRKGGWGNGSLDRVQSVETAEVARV